MTAARGFRGLVEDVVASLPHAATAACDPGEIEAGVFRLVLDLAPDDIDETAAGHPSWLRRHGSPESVAALEEAARLHGSPGKCHQELLGLRIRRLDGPAVCLRDTGTWILLDEILREPPETRSKWLMRKAGLPKTQVGHLAEPLANASTQMAMAIELGARAGGGPVRERGVLVVDTGAGRRLAGAHYTPEPLARAVIERALGPLVDGRSSGRILELRICDPAMGDGAFLLAAASFLALHLARALEREARESTDGAGLLFDLVTRCLYGVDRDPIAVELARRALLRRLEEGGAVEPQRKALARSLLEAHLSPGDSLVGAVRRSPPAPAAPSPPFDWYLRFTEVFEEERDGFDAVVGNPPWVAYAGRAAQPLPPSVFAYYQATSPAFGGYRTLHGLFAHRAAELLREGGRLGLLLPTSIADLSGYAPARAAHDHLCTVDPELLDFGDGAFEGVFQPCMALTSTRRRAPSDAPGKGQAWLPGLAPTAERAPAHASPAAWPLARPDLDATAAGLLLRLGALPTLPAELFGERGFQSTADDLSHLRRLEQPRPPFVVPLREGSDVSELQLLPPSLFADPTKLAGRLRSSEDFEKVAIVVRQTARYPIAALSDGLPFRNSLLAAFESEEWPRHALVLYLNSTAIRWYHFTRHRDARQGMPQLKIGHLRALPTLADERARSELAALGRASGPTGPLGVDARAAVDRCVFDALGLTAEERATALFWHGEHPLPVRRAASRRARTPGC